MAVRIQAIRGMKDFWFDKSERLYYIEKIARQVFKFFGFKELKTPILEKTDLFYRSIGEDTDIIEKEMYTFLDKSNNSLTMRPEGTVGMVRAFIESKKYALPGPYKMFQIGPMFRYERPQKGRLRQFTQIDVETLGDEGPASDVELIVMLDYFLKLLRINKVKLKINTLGCEVCRPEYKEKLCNFLDTRRESFCKDCFRRLRINPLRVLDCKKESCQNLLIDLPVIHDFLCADCGDHFDALKTLLDGVKIEYELDMKLVRGLDYYTKTVFEIVVEEWGTQNAVIGGGRYDNLVGTLGGPELSAVGFALGMERLALLMKEQKGNTVPALYIIFGGEKENGFDFFSLVFELRYMGFWVEFSFKKTSLKSQLRKANKFKVSKVLILGTRDLEHDKGWLKNMEDGSQFKIELKADKIGAILKNK